MKKLVNDLAKKNVLFRQIARFIFELLFKIRYCYYLIRYKTEDNIILFEAFAGKNYTCSPKAIYEQMLEMKRFDNYQFIWAFNNPDKHMIKSDKRTKVIVSGSSEYYKYMSKSHYWIINYMLPTFIKKKKNQIYVQCWHGTPLKKLRYDIEVEGAALNTTKEIRKRNDKDVKRYDYFISPSKYSSEKFTSSFNLNKLHKMDIIIEEGYPRNDFLFNKTNNDIENIKKKLKLPLNKKIMFYMPTFRDNQHDSKLGYTHKLELDLDKLMKKYKKEYILLFSVHYFVENKIDVEKYKNFVFNVSGYDEINELYLISDILITDYSSIFFDYANLNKPIIFYMYDLNLYKNDLRDFYINLEELPGNIVTNQNELEKEIDNIDISYKQNKEKYLEFNKKYNYLDDGYASSRVINKLFKEE